MSSLKLVVLKNEPLTNGRYKIKVSLFHKKVTSYISTNFSVSSPNNFKNGVVIKEADANIVNSKLRHLLNKYQDRLDAIDNPNQYTCQQLKKLLVETSDIDRATIGNIANKYIELLNNQKRNNYAILIERSVRYFYTYAKGDLFLEDITPTVIEGFSNYLKQKKNHYNGAKISNASVSMILARLKVVINYAVKMQFVYYKIHPFINVRIQKAVPKDAEISIESLIRIRDAELSSKPLQVARDAFMLSFYLAGINFIDLLQVDFRKDNVDFVRSKTKNNSQGQKIVFAIPPQAKDIADRWLKKGRLDFGYQFSYENLLKYVSRNVNKLGEHLELKEHLTYYSARKTFSQIASDLGIPDSIIDYCLGHSDSSKGVLRYYTKVRTRQAELAISRVIDFTENPEKYEDYLDMRSDMMLTFIK